MTQDRGHGLGVVGVGVAACVACCAGPIVAFLAGLSLAGLLSTVLVGTAGLVIAGLVLVGRLVMRRRLTACPVPAEVPVPVGAPTRRSADLERSAR